MLNGKIRDCEIYKENTHTVWVYNPGNLRKKVRIRKRKLSLEDLPSSMQAVMPRYFLGMLPSIPQNVEVNDSNPVIKRHKKKHNFSKF